MGLTLDDVRGQLEICVWPDINLCSQNAAARFSARCEGFDLVIVDHLRAAVPQGDENDSQFGSYLNLLHRVCAPGTALYLAHTRKIECGKVTIADLRGSGAITANSGTIWSVNPGIGDGARLSENLRAHDTAFGLVEPMWIRASPGNFGELPTGTYEPRALRLEAFDCDPNPRRDAGAAEELRQRVLSAIQASPGIGSSGLRAACAPAKAEAVDQAVHYLISNRTVEDRGSGGLRAPRNYYAIETTPEAAE
jgi:hypothetical protein